MEILIILIMKFFNQISIFGVVIDTNQLQIWFFISIKKYKFNKVLQN